MFKHGGSAVMARCAVVVACGYGASVGLALQPCSVGKITASDGTQNDHFGISVSIDGDHAIVGAWADNAPGTDSGSAYVFERDGIDWTQQSKITASDSADNDFFGFSVGISGAWAAVGAYGDDALGSSSGSVYFFNEIGSSWSQVSRLTASDGSASDEFGKAVAIDGDYAVVGAHLDDPSGTDSGSAYVFIRSGQLWTEQAKLIASDGAASDEFGVSVAISGDTVVIGSTGDDDGATNAGSAYVFRRSGTTWTQEAKLVALDPSGSKNFGFAVSMSGESAAVGAYGDDSLATDAGAAYVFTRSGVTWSQEVKLTASDGTSTDNFGYSVAIAGDELVAGAQQDDVGGTNTGSVYAFARNGGVWTQTGKLPGGSVTSSSFRGTSASLKNGFALVGARDDDSPANGSGSAFVYYVGQLLDCNGNLQSDVCEQVAGTGDDCNGNDVLDECDVDSGTSEDCSGNGVPDECERDCNANGIADSCDIQSGTSEDCTGNGIPDECVSTPLLADDFATTDLDPGRWVVFGDVSVDTVGSNEPSEYYSARFNGFPDGGDDLQSAAINLTGLEKVQFSYYWERTGGGEDPDSGEDLRVQYRNSGGAWITLVQYEGSGPDMTEYAFAVHDLPADAYHSNFAIRFFNTASAGPNDDWFVDNILVAEEGEPDCNANGISDACDIADGNAEDCSGNGIPDTCENDCNENGVADSCDIVDGTDADCDGNGFLDSCDIGAGMAEDCNNNGIPDSCGGEFCQSRGIELASHITPFEFGASAGNSLWGYVSPSGREYAIMGLDTGTAFVEVTDPRNPVVVEQIDGPNSTWRDMKTYQHYSYSVSEGGNGIQVMDLDDIDSGVVTLVTEVTTGGTAATHTLALNEDSGFLYRAGGGNEGIRIYSLANPALPVYVSEYSAIYVHEAQIITYVDGPYAGREIAFLCGGTDSGFTDPGLYIVDVTNKANLFLVGVCEYPMAAFAHQGWVSPDRTLFYLDDEFDETTFGIPGTTHVIDISVLESPMQVATFSNGNPAIDHNLYTLGRFIFESNYTSGLRVFDATDPLAPVEIGYYDTYMADNNPVYAGLWNNYPYLPSRIVLGSDIESGLYVWDISQLIDCNGNGVDDGEDIAEGVSRDCDTDRIPDECVFADCNENCIPDGDDVSSGTSEDADQDGIPDECQGSACAGDANGDGMVDPLDSGFVLARFGCDLGAGDPACTAADVNGDGVVDPLDSGYVLARLGTCNPG